MITNKILKYLMKPLYAKILDYVYLHIKSNLKFKTYLITF